MPRPGRRIGGLARRRGRVAASLVALAVGLLVPVAASAAAPDHTAVRAAQQSYETEGITNDLRRFRQLRKIGASFGEARYWVFDREGEACYSCGGAIARISIASRRLYYCPACQGGTCCKSSMEI